MLCFLSSKSKCCGRGRGRSSRNGLTRRSKGGPNQRTNQTRSACTGLTLQLRPQAAVSGGVGQQRNLLPRLDALHNASEKCDAGCQLTRWCWSR